MKSGSIVECIKTHSPHEIRKDINIIRLPQKGEILTVSQVIKNPLDGAILLQFEEFKMGYNPVGVELGAEIEFFREIEFPPNIEEEIQEALTTPVKESIGY